jgi:hypothetical protein
MRYDQSDGRFDLIDRGPQHCPKHRRRSDRAMQHVIDFVRFERKHFRQPAADLVERQHAALGDGAIQSAVLRGRNRHGIEIVVPKLTRHMAARGIVTEVRAVGIPLADGRTIGHDGLLGFHPHVGAEAARSLVVGGAVLQRFLSR